MADTENSIVQNGLTDISMSVNESSGLPQITLQVDASDTVQAPVDATLTKSGQAADAKVTGTRLNALETAAPKVAKPETNPDGTNGQLLRTNGDGTTAWVDEGLPTDEQTMEALSDWLDEHAATAGYVMTVSNNKLIFTVPNE